MTKQVMMPVEPTGLMLRAMAESKAVDEMDGTLESLHDLLDFSGENKVGLVLKAAYKALLEAVPQDGGEPVFWQFWCETEKAWCNFIDERHRKNTIDAGIEVRPLYVHPKPEPDWIKCSDKYPEEVDADPFGFVFSLDKYNSVVLRHYSNVDHPFDLWMPTGLTLPQPPKEPAE